MFLNSYLVLVGGEVVDKAGGGEYRYDEEGGAEDPPPLVIVPPDLEHGHPVQEPQDEQQGRVHVQQQERFLGGVKETIEQKLYEKQSFCSSLNVS